MRKSLLLIMAAFFVMAAVPSFGATTCTYHDLGSTTWYQCINNGDFTGTTNWTVAPSGNVDTTHTGESMCGTGWTHFAKSTGAYGYANLDQTFTTDGSSQSVFDINLTVELTNSHSSSLNRLYLVVYNVTDSTSETIASINGGNGDICGTTYSYTVTRSGWVGKDMKYSIQEDFWNSDTKFNVSVASFIQRKTP